MAGKPEAVAEIRNALKSLPSDLLNDPKCQAMLTKAAFPHELDTFQLTALNALASGESVVLSAPTGAGKTIVGEMAIYLALARGLRVFYTTPLKALSNQKFSDFRRQFGPDRVGLLTGDVTVNREADVVVMTTEVYRNMLYGGIDTEAMLTERLFATVFDEFHYLNDRTRGTVWEESVINSPVHVLLVALSATMSNTKDVRDWFAHVQGPTRLIETGHRPVPLRFGFCNSDGMTPLFAESRAAADSDKKGFVKKEKPNNKRPKGPRLRKLHPKLMRSLQDDGILQNTGRSRGRERGKRKESSSVALSNALKDKKSLDKLILSMRSGARRRNGPRDRFVHVPSYPFVVRSLRRRDMLPGIVFIFSRAGCDRAAVAASEERDALVSPAEASELARRLDAFSTQHPDLVQKQRIALAAKGIASHHAGLLPIWKLFVEELFQDGLIKVVFATETLAAGINMPARTTVISALSKRAGAEGIVSLTTSEVLQMAGRAGRRGKDVLGHSVILRSRFEGVLDAFRVVTADVDALKSKFMPTYGMVLNLLQTRSLDDSRKLIERSFGNFLRVKRATEVAESVEGTEKEESGNELERAALQTVLDKCTEVLAGMDAKEVRSYARCLERVKAEKRALTYLMSQSKAGSMEDTLAFAPSGMRLLLRDPKPVGTSKGALRRKKRRSYLEALTAARNGDGGEELRSYYLGAEDEDNDALVSGLLEDTSGKSATLREAVLVDMYAETSGVLPMFAAVDETGAFRIFNHLHVASIVVEEEVEEIDFDELMPDWRDVALPARTDWAHLGEEQYTAEIPEELGELFAKVTDWQKELASSKSVVDGVGENEAEETEQDPDVNVQQKRVQDAIQTVLEHPLHASGDGARAQRAKLAASQAEAALAGTADGKRRKARKRSRRKPGGEDHAAADAEEQEDGTWGDFMSIASVLQTYGFLDDSFGVTSLGELGAQLKADNELWSSLVLLDPSLSSVSPAHLGAVLGATQLEPARADAYVGYEPSGEVLAAVSKLAPMRTRLAAVQEEYGVEACMLLDAEMVGIVEAWASGISWFDLLGNTSLQEGDVCRVLRRVLDLLRQVPRLPGVPDETKLNAMRAVALMDRFPVTDDVTYVVQEGEKLREGDEGEGN